MQGMEMAKALPLLFLAACLEVGGDALIARGLHAGGLMIRLGLCGLGAIMLLAYGVSVNLPAWDFGRLLGIYVVFFFLIAQLVSAWLTGTFPSLSVWIASVFIFVGGLVLTFA